MLDYYTHVNELSEDKLHEEIRKIYDRLFKTSQTSPTYQQLLNMLDMAEGALQERQQSRMIKKEDSIIEIGQIDSKVDYPDYTQDEILTAIVTEYRKDPGATDK